MERQKTLGKKKSKNKLSSPLKNQITQKEPLKMLQLKAVQQFEEIYNENGEKMNMNKSEYQNQLWKETTDGTFVPFLKFDVNIKEIEGGEALTKIDNRKEGGIVQINQGSTQAWQDKKIKMLKPQEIAYHPKHGYVRLDKDNSIQVNEDGGQNQKQIEAKKNTWECTIVQRDDEGKAIFPEDAKSINIDPQELKFFIQVEMLALIEKQIQQSKHKVAIEDNMQRIIQPLQTLHQAKFVAVADGRHIDIQQSFYKNGIIDKQKILLNGLNTEEDFTKRDIKFFKRFKDFKNGDNWSVGKDLMDAIMLVPSVDVIIYGVGIFEEYPNGEEFTLGYKYIIKDSSDSQTLSKSQLYEELVPHEPEKVNEHVISHIFKNIPQGIKVGAGQYFNFIQWVSCEKCYYSESGASYEQIENPDTGIFTVKGSQYSTNSTELNRGIIPGFLYALA
eukprot:403342763